MINITRLLARAVRCQPTTPTILFRPAYSFAFMQLFQLNKKPQQLDPIFKRQTYQKGHVRFKGTKKHSIKLNPNAKKQKQRLKNHKGLLKRVKIVGPRYARRFKFLSPGKRHLNRHKSRANMWRKSRARYVHKADMARVKKLIPYYKRKSLKMRY